MTAVLEPCDTAPVTTPTLPTMRGQECPLSPSGYHQKSSVPGKENTCQFCGRPC